MTYSSIENESSARVSNNNTEDIMSKKAMLVSLHTSCWTGRVTDKAVGQEVCVNKLADKKAGNFTKAIIDKNELKQIRSILSEARTYHNEMTLSWNDQRQRLLPSSLFSDYTAAIRKLQSDLETEVQEFKKAYPNLVNEATYWLGDLFERADYPDEREIEKKFGLEMEVSPMPASNDFRVQISDQEKEQVKKQISQTMEKKFEKAMKRIWEKIYVAVEKIHKKTSDKDAVFRNSMMKNFKSLVDLLPELNITNDEKLTEMTEVLKNQVYDYDPDELRKNKETRKEAANKTKQILDNLEGLYV